MEMLRDLIWTDESDTVVTPLSDSRHFENATDCGGGIVDPGGMPWWDRFVCD